MTIIINYIKRYYQQIDKKAFLLLTLFTAFLIFCNYYFLIYPGIQKNNSFLIKLIEWCLVYLVAFFIPHIILYIKRKNKIQHPRVYLFLLLMAPLLFSFKQTASLFFHISDNQALNTYLNAIIYWPVLLLLIAASLIIIWRVFYKDQIFFGLSSIRFNYKPYLLLLLIMIPLIVVASTQHDFQIVYPKLQRLAYLDLNRSEQLLFEISYGSDFFTIELFFRGFLVLGFIRWAGKDAILPMAIFYCTIHFGKPLGECISSYFGGLLLGIVVYNTKSIWGGLIVHVGIAWLMEIGGYFGNLYG